MELTTDLYPDVERDGSRVFENSTSFGILQFTMFGLPIKDAHDRIKDSSMYSTSSIGESNKLHSPNIFLHPMTIHDIIATMMTRTIVLMNSIILRMGTIKTMADVNALVE